MQSTHFNQAEQMATQVSGLVERSGVEIFVRKKTARLHCDDSLSFPVSAPQWSGAVWSLRVIRSNFN